MSGHDSNYFSTTKKGEIPELKDELNSQYKVGQRFNFLCYLCYLFFSRSFFLSDEAQCVDPLKSTSVCSLQIMAEIFYMLFMGFSIIIMPFSLMFRFLNYDHSGQGFDPLNRIRRPTLKLDKDQPRQRALLVVSKAMTGQSIWDKPKVFMLQFSSSLHIMYHLFLYACLQQIVDIERCGIFIAFKWLDKDLNS